MTKLSFIPHINRKEQKLLSCKQKRHYRHLQYYRLTSVFLLVLKINGGLKSSGNLLSTGLEKRGAVFR